MKKTILALGLLASPKASLAHVTDLSAFVDYPKSIQNQLSLTSSSLYDSHNFKHKDFLEALKQLPYPEGFSLKFSPPKNLPDFLAASKTLEFYLHGIRLCEYEIKLHTLKNGEEFMTGKAPIPFVIDRKNSARLAPSIANFKSILEQSGITHNLFLTEKEKCYVIRDGVALSAYLMTLKTAGKTEAHLSYSGILDEKDSYALRPLFFHTTKTAKVFPNNSLDSSTQSFELKEMDDNNKLENTWFYTTIDSSSSNQNATSTDNAFNFDHGSSEFDQTSIFTHANVTYDWFKSIGYESIGDTKMRLVVHASIGGDSNNALYQPSSSGSSTIYIGDGDGKVLKNLATDADVVSHEFGHHVIFSTLTATTGESLVIHEGMADYFTFARTGNACLGESICPKDSIIGCAKEEQCLRTAENEYSYQGSNLPVEPHLRSQFISGLMWDLTAKDGIDRSLVSRTALAAIMLLSKDSGYRDLIVSMLKADLSISSGAHCATIYNRAVSRGLGNILSDFTCSDDVAAIDRTAAEVPSTTKTSSGGSFNCAISSKGRGGPHFILFLLPFCLYFFRKKDLPKREGLF